MNELIQVFKEVLMQRYATFTGRAGLKEYWYYFFVTLCIGIFFVILTLTFMKSVVMMTVINFVRAFVSLGLLIPGLALTVRRLHDTGRGGGWIFISLIPILGLLYWLYLMLLKGEPTANRFGEPVE